MANPPPPYYMPIRGSTNAPSFDGKSENLRRFFEDVEEHAVRAAINDERKIYYTIRYANPTDGETWELLPSRPANDFNAWKDEVFGLYPSLDNDRKYTVSDLERLVDTYRTKRITTKEELGDYHRDFMRISVFLIGKNRISSRERNRWYHSGFQSDLRDKISQRLAIVKSDVNPDDSYEYLDVHKAAIFILNSSSSDQPRSIPPASSYPSAPSNPIAPIVKTESQESELLRQLSLQISALTTAIGQNMSASAPAAVVTPAPNAPIAPAQRPPTPRAPASFAPATTNACLFCGADANEHQVRTCPIAEQYLREGKCSRSAEGRIVLPDGTQIPRTVRGRWIKDRLDSYHELFGNRSQPMQRDLPPHMTVGLFEVAPDTSVFEIAVERSTDSWVDPDLARLEMLQVELQKAEALVKEKKKKNVRFDGVDMPPVPSWGKSQPPIAKEKSKKPDPPAPTEEPVNNPPMVPLPPTSPATPATKVPTPPEATSTPKDTGPQYRYHAPIQDPALAKLLLDRALDAPIQTTSRELLSALPDLRRQLRELLMSKRVASTATFVDTSDPVMNVESFLHAHPDRYTGNVAEHSMPLRVVYPEIGNGVRPECILDYGAQIVAMRRDIWESLDLPLHSQKIMVMQSANNTHNHTLGVVEDVEVRFGPIALRLQIQVVDDAPFEVLLGRPFYALASCVTRDVPSRESTIELTDLNSGEVAMFVTHPHRQRPQVGREQGF